MQLVLFTTTDMQSDRGSELQRMMGSVAAARTVGIEVKHFILLQRCPNDAAQTFARDIPYPAVILSREQRLPLSDARNVMLEHARRDHCLDARTVVGFPDDDCWYPEGAVAEVVQAFAADADLGPLVCGVSLEPSGVLPADASRAARPGHVLRKSTSNSIFIRGDIVAEIGSFDEKLGLGTRLVAGEDTDFALRAWFASRRSVFVDAPLVGHHAPDLASVSRYFGGSAVVAGRYATRNRALAYEYLRKLAVGAFLVMSRRLKATAFVDAVLSSLSAMRHGRIGDRADVR